MTKQTQTPEPVGYFCDHSDEPYGARTHYDWEWDEVNGGHTFQHAPNTISAHTGVDRGYLKPEDAERRCPRALPVYAVDVPALLARINELEAERHSTNEALSEAAEALRAKDQRIAELETRVDALERPAIEAKRTEIRSSYTELIAQAEQDRDYEGSFTLQGQLDEREAQWAAEDATKAVTQ